MSSTTFRLEYYNPSLELPPLFGLPAARKQESCQVRRDNSPLSPRLTPSPELERPKLTECYLPPLSTSDRRHHDLTEIESLAALVRELDVEIDGIIVAAFHDLTQKANTREFLPAASKMFTFFNEIKERRKRCCAGACKMTREQVSQVASSPLLEKDTLLPPSRTNVCGGRFVIPSFYLSVIDSTTKAVELKIQRLEKELKAKELELVQKVAESDFRHHHMDPKPLTPSASHAPEDNDIQADFDLFLASNSVQDQWQCESFISSALKPYAMANDTQKANLDTTSISKDPIIPTPQSLPQAKVATDGPVGVAVETSSQEKFGASQLSVPGTASKFTVPHFGSSEHIPGTLPSAQFKNHPFFQQTQVPVQPLVPMFIPQRQFPHRRFPFVPLQVGKPMGSHPCCQVDTTELIRLGLVPNARIPSHLKDSVVRMLKANKHRSSVLHHRQRRELVFPQRYDPIFGQKCRTQSTMDHPDFAHQTVQSLQTVPALYENRPKIPNPLNNPRSRTVFRPQVSSTLPARPMPSNSMASSQFASRQGVQRQGLQAICGPLGPNSRFVIGAARKLGTPIAQPANSATLQPLPPQLVRYPAPPPLALNSAASRFQAAKRPLPPATPKISPANGMPDNQPTLPTYPAGGVAPKRIPPPGRNFTPFQPYPSARPIAHPTASRPIPRRPAPGSHQSAQTIPAIPAFNYLPLKNPSFAYPVAHNLSFNKPAPQIALLAFPEFDPHPTGLPRLTPAAHATAAALPPLAPSSSAPTKRKRAHRDLHVFIQPAAGNCVPGGVRAAAALRPQQDLTPVSATPPPQQHQQQPQLFPSTRRPLQTASASASIAALPASPATAGGLDAASASALPGPVDLGLALAGIAEEPFSFQALLEMAHPSLESMSPAAEPTDACELGGVKRARVDC